MAAEAQVLKDSYKDHFFNKLYSRLQEGLARKADDPSVTFLVLYSTTASISRTYKSIYEKRQSENKQKNDKKDDKKPTGAVINSNP